MAELPLPKPMSNQDIADLINNLESKFDESTGRPLYVEFQKRWLDSNEDLFDWLSGIKPQTDLLKVREHIILGLTFADDDDMELESKRLDQIVFITKVVYGAGRSDLCFDSKTD
jgi:hypothetical protein